MVELNKVGAGFWIRSTRWRAHEAYVYASAFRNEELFITVGQDKTIKEWDSGTGMDGCMDAWMNGCMDEWMDGWVGG
jgi:hypothetical protein